MSSSFTAELEALYGVKNQPEVAVGFFKDFEAHLKKSTEGRLFDEVFQRRMRDKSLIFSSQNGL
jgi:hypothetical protein